MQRQNYLVSTFSEIALEQFQLLKENYQQLEKLDKMCGEAVDLKHEICNNYVTTITFAAMSLEAFLNDYAAQNLGDDFYYKNFENLRPFAKLQLIARTLFNTTVESGGKIQEYINILVSERNSLVHCKSKELIGMNEEEYIEYKQFFQTHEDAKAWLLAENERVHTNEEKNMLDNAIKALRALKEVARYIDEHDSSAFATIGLLRSGWYIGSNREKYSLIKAAQLFLGVTPLVFDGDE